MAEMRNCKGLKCSLRATEKEFGLPPHRIIFRETGEENGWASAYGGIIELANYANLNRFLSCPFNAMWQHGIFPEYAYKSHPQKLTYGMTENLDKQVLVANDDQKECLERFGFTNVHAIGTPFAYAKPIKIPERRLGTILWMPPHSLPGEKESWSHKTEEAVGWLIQKYGGSYRDNVYACLHNECIKNELWWPELLKSNIPIIRGGSHSDGNCYRRMWILLSQIDIVSTNAYGSHIFYALAAGCRVRIEGPLVEPVFNKEKMAAKPYFQRLASQGLPLEQVISDSARKTTTYKALLGEESCDKQLGERMIGIQQRLNPSEIRELLGWNRSSQLLSTAKYGPKSIARIIISILRYVARKIQAHTTPSD